MTGDKYLRNLAEKYSTKKSVQAEIINLKAKLRLPKGTEHFMSDIHGEYEAFTHILNNCSGEIRDKVKTLFGEILDDLDIDNFCTLIYYPERKMELIKRDGKYTVLWQQSALFKLIAVTREVTAKYTRSTIRQVLPKEFALIIDEILNANFNDNNSQAEYYQRIIENIIELEVVYDFIIAFASLIKRMTVDHLHIVGDIFDRGSRPDLILDLLSERSNVDIQWGNHDVLWLGAAAGNEICAAAVVVNCVAFGNLSVLEQGYGINLRHLALFSERTYKSSPCFAPRILNKGIIEKSGELYKKIYKAIAIIMFKLEGAYYLDNPHLGMTERALLKTIDYHKNEIILNGVTYPLLDSDFPTIDRSDPLALTKEERTIIDELKQGFMQSLQLKKHARFLFSNGSMYKVYNNNLLFHSCVPMNNDFTFSEIEINGEKAGGKALMEKVEQIIRRAYSHKQKEDIDFIWYLYCGKCSPLFGRNKLTTFERLYIKDVKTHAEISDFYYHCIETAEGCKKILNEFGLNGENSRIINGHVPVAVNKGETPIKAEGKLIVIDGGFCKAYHPKTGIAGYTLISNSRELRLIAHTPFHSIENAIENNTDIHSVSSVIEKMNARVRVIDTDAGNELLDKINDLKLLLQAYESGVIPEGGVLTNL